MENRICRLEFQDEVINPTLAEILLTVVPGQWRPELSIEARMVGPRCRYASTVEVAYPFQPAPEASGGTLSKRVVIPEPSLWEPTCPFLYQVTIELRDSAETVGIASAFHGLRKIEIGRAGFRLNGKPFVPRVYAGGLRCEEDLLGVRNGGYSAVLLPGRPAVEPLWNVCDEIGLAVLGHGRLPAGDCARHACVFAWLIDAGHVDSVTPEAVRGLQVPIGVRVDEDSVLADTKNPGISFAVGRDVNGVARWNLPAIIESEEISESPRPADALGVIVGQF